jgi:hypothetical protein
MSAKHAETIVESGKEIFIPLNKLKKSRKNARKTPHSEAAIEAYAASIAAKGILENPGRRTGIGRRRYGYRHLFRHHRRGQAACPASAGEAEGDQEDRADPLYRRYCERPARDQP